MEQKPKQGQKSPLNSACILNKYRGSPPLTPSLGMYQLASEPATAGRTAWAGAGRNAGRGWVKSPLKLGQYAAPQLHSARDTAKRKEKKKSFAAPAPRQPAIRQLALPPPTNFLCLGITLVHVSRSRSHCLFLTRLRMPAAPAGAGWAWVLYGSAPQPACSRIVRAQRSGCFCSERTFGDHVLGLYLFFNKYFLIRILSFKAPFIQTPTGTLFFQV